MTKPYKVWVVQKAKTGSKEHDWGNLGELRIDGEEMVLSLRSKHEWYCNYVLVASRGRDNVYRGADKNIPNTQASWSWDGFEGSGEWSEGGQTFELTISRYHPNLKTNKAA